MMGKIIDSSNTEATVAFCDGSTVNISTSYLPCNFKTGDNINIELSNTNMTGRGHTNISSPPICWIIYMDIL